MKLYYRTLGEGQPFIILHGLFGSSDNWLTISKQFAEKYRVFVLDQRNHGQSPHADGHNYELMAADLKEFIEEHRLENPILLGHSMGGKTVMKFVNTYDTPVDKLIVVDIAPKAYPPHHQLYIGAMLAIDMSKIQSRQEAENIFIAKGVTNIGERQFLMKNIYRDNDGNFKWKINLDVLVKEIDNIGEGTPENAHCEIPTLFVKGEKSEYYIRKEDAAFIHQVFVNSKIVTIAGSGHWVQAEKPVEFYNAVMDFCK